MRIIIDVREKEEFDRSHVSKALNIPLSKLMHGQAKLDTLPKNAELVVYCNSGNRSGMAEKILKNQGFSEVKNGINQQNVEKYML